MGTEADLASRGMQSVGGPSVLEGGGGRLRDGRTDSERETPKPVDTSTTARLRLIWPCERETPQPVDILGVESRTGL
jgi:hypothetical protein